MKKKRKYSHLHSESWMQQRIIAFLEKRGYKITHQSKLKSHGVDIKCYSPKKGRYYFVEVKPDPNPPKKTSIGAMRENYFICGLGELLLRMTQEHGRYALGLPDNKIFRTKIQKIPRRVKKLLKLDFFLVDEDGNVEVFK
jgi:hypothetical protein